MPSEASAWATLRQHIPGHIQRFEDKLASGIPDANFCWNGYETWLEGKFLKEYPKRDSTLIKLGLRKEQRVWARQRSREGGVIILWARVPDGWRFWMESCLSTAQFDAVYEGIPYGIWKETSSYKSAAEMVSAMLYVISWDRVKWQKELREHGSLYDSTLASAMKEP